MLIWNKKIILMENNTYRKINLTKEDSMSKQILFKKTRESIIKKLSNPY